MPHAAWSQIWWSKDFPFPSQHVTNIPGSHLRNHHVTRREDQFGAVATSNSQVPSTLQKATEQHIGFKSLYTPMGYKEDEAGAEG